MGREIWIYRGKKQLIGVDYKRPKNGRRLVVGLGRWACVDAWVWILTAVYLVRERIPRRLDVYLYEYFMGKIFGFQINIRNRFWIFGFDNSLSIFRRIQGRKAIIQVTWPYVHMSSFNKL